MICQLSNTKWSLLVTNFLYDSNMLTYEEQNFLTDIELLFIEEKRYDNKTFVSNEGKKLNLYQVELPDSVTTKISKYGKITRSEVYKLQEPYRIHNDARNDVTSKFTCILPLDLEPQGGVTIFHQYADQFTYSLDPYYTSDYNKILPIESRSIINEWDPKNKLPDTEEFSHIRDEDKIGFTVAHQFKFEFNKLVVFPSIHFHCSNNVHNFESKSSLVAFTI